MGKVWHTFLLLAFLIAGCAHERGAPPFAPPPPGKQVKTAADAIAVVLADIQRRGGDPRREECSAVETNGFWEVTAWHVVYPHHTGASRFVPGGFTDYFVSHDGRILRTEPGL